MDLAPVESRIILALEAIETNKKLSIRAAAKIYNVPASGATAISLRSKKMQHPPLRLSG
jgi:hypothetical protein